MCSRSAATSATGRDTCRAGSSQLDAAGLNCLALSPVYTTAPVGAPSQPDYLNAVLVADTTLTAAELLARCQATEAAFQRTRTGGMGSADTGCERHRLR